MVSQVSTIAHWQSALILLQTIRQRQKDRRNRSQILYAFLFRYADSLTAAQGLDQK